MASSSQSFASAFAPRDASFRANPYPVYHALREVSPVHFRPEKNEWIITGHAEVMALAKDSRLGHHLTMPQPPSVATVSPPVREVSEVMPLLQLRRQALELRENWIFMSDPPHHTRLRKAIQPAFGAGKVEALRFKAQSFADAALDRVEARGEMDLIRDYCSPLTFSIIADLMGMPIESRPLLQRVTPDISALCDIGIAPLTLERGILALAQVMQFWREYKPQWRANPVSEATLMNSLMRAWDEGTISETELLSQYGVFLFAGYTTVQHLIGTSVLALLRHPDQWKKLQGQPQLLRVALEECLRFDAPVQVKVETALDDIEISGYSILKGQQLYLLLGAANRDPAVFPDPDRFDITRQPGPHVSFGRGIHYCVGSLLGKMELEIALTTLLRRLPRLRLHGEPEWDATFLLHGLKALPVAFD